MAIDAMRNFRHRFFASGLILGPVAGWVLAAALLVLLIIVGSARMAADSPTAAIGDSTDLVLRIRGLPYSGTANGYRNDVAIFEAQLLIRTRLLTEENGVAKLLIDARLISGDGQSIWSSTTISENTGLESVQEEIGRTLTEAMQHVGMDDGRISI